MHSERGTKAIIMIILLLTSIFSIGILIMNRYQEIPVKATMNQEPINQQIFDETSTWLYLDQGLNPGSDVLWTTVFYDDTLRWKQANNDFGLLTYGDKNALSNPNDRSTAFFRTEFHLKDIKAYTSITGSIEYSGAVVIYLNGTVVYAGNVPAGGYQSNLDRGTEEARNDLQKNAIQITNLSGLREGKNVIGIELHSNPEDNSHAYLEVSNLSLHKEPIENPMIDISSLVLEIGRTDDEVMFNWLTDSEETYEVLYEKLEDYQRHQKSNQGLGDTNTVLLEKQLFINNTHKLYINRAKIQELALNTDYVYQIRRVGGIEISPIYSFHTSAVNHDSFVVLNDLRLGSNNAMDDAGWQSTIEKINSLEMKPNWILSVGNQMDGVNSEESIMENYWNFRKPSTLKQIPVCVLQGNHEAVGVAKQLYESQFAKSDSNQQGDYHFTKNGNLFIVIHPYDSNLTAHTEYIKNVIANTSHTWSVVLMNPPIYSSKKLESEFESYHDAYAKLFEQLDIDVVISGDGYGYERYQTKKVESPSTTKHQKLSQDTLYVVAGSLQTVKNDTNNSSHVEMDFSYEESVPTIIGIDIHGLTFELNVYRIDTYDIVDHYELMK